MIDLFRVFDYTILPLLCGFVILVVGYLKLSNLRKTSSREVIGIFSIWLIGIIAFLLGILGQILNMINTFDTLAMAGDISPSILAEGIKGSYKPTIYGLLVLMFSLIFWGILKGVKEKRVNFIRLIKETE